jgi:ribose transport system permease protein
VIETVDVDVTSTEAVARRRRRVVALLQGQGLLLMLVLVGTYFALNSPFFLTGNNLLIIGGGTAALGIMAVAQTFLIISGGIDISVGSVVALSGVVLGTLLVAGAPLPVATIAAVLSGTAVGAFNALLVVRLRIDPFIATLGSLSLFSGVAFTLTNGQTRSIVDPALAFIGIGRLGGIPVPLLLFVFVFAVGLVFERLTAWGRTVYAIGGNYEAARLSGLPVKRTQVTLYLLSGTSAGLAGALTVAQLASASPQVGANYLLSVVTAVILGGTSLSGGRGSLVGTLIAVAILGVLANGFALLGWTTNAQTMALGAALLVAVLLDRATRALRAKGARG